jgi:replicative DNA helicase
MPITSGLKSIDDSAGKFIPGETIIVTSADAVTRTAFVLNIALKNADHHRVPTAILSSVMPIGQIAKWVIMSLNDHQIMSKHTPLYLESIDKLNIADLKERIVRLKRSFLVEIVIIDSIDHIDGLNLLAKELNIVLILTSSKDIAKSDLLADILINIYVMETYDDQNKRIIDIKRNGKDVANIKAMFNRRHARFYDIGENDEPPIYN